MNTDELSIIKLSFMRDIPKGYTGIVEWCDNGTKEWFVNGLYHREDGPAIEYNDGKKVYCLNGVLYYTFEEFFEATTDEGREAIIWKMDEYQSSWG